MCDYEEVLEHDFCEKDLVEKDPIEKHEEFIVDQYFKSKQIDDQDIFVVIDDLSLKSKDLPF